MKPQRAFAGNKPADRILSIIHAIQAEYQSQLEEAQRSIARLEERASGAATEWQVERQRYEQQITTLERDVDTANARATEDSDISRELEQKLEETLRVKARLASDFQRLVSELNALEQKKGAEEPDRGGYGEVATVVRSEMARIQLVIDEIERKLADPGVELSAEIRMNRERTELEAYLKGLRYSLGEVTPCLESL
jgi:chromosome segregation ATPase